MRYISFLTCQLTLQSPGGVTEPGVIEDFETITKITTDHTGKPCIPGTSLAGVLRSQWQQMHGEASAKSVFGEATDHNESDQADGCDDATAAGSVASPVWVFDATAVGDAVPQEIMRTAIDRERNAAANHTLRKTEQLPVGTRFDVVLKITGENEKRDQHQKIVDDLTKLLHGATLRLGKGTSYGSGKCQVQQVRVGNLDLTNDDHLLSWLQTPVFDLAESIAQEVVELDQKHEPPQVVSARFTTTSPVCVHGQLAEEKDADGETRKNLTKPLTVKDHQGKSRYPIPGSTLKGIVRSRMEFILRSVGLPASAPSDYISGSETPSTDCLISAWFGYGGTKERTTLRDENDRPEVSTVGARGKVIVEASEFTPNTGKTIRVVQQSRVAIDRFTGGAADEKLFSVAGVTNAEWELNVDYSRLDAAEQQTFAALFRLVCQDLHDGLLGLGRFTHAGFGSVQCDTNQLDQVITLADAKKRLQELVEHHQANRTKNLADV